MEKIVHYPLEKRFVLVFDDVEAFLQYELISKRNADTKVIDFTRTFVPPEFRGKGFAEQLVRAGVKWAKEQGYEMRASCSYAAKFIC